MTSSSKLFSIQGQSLKLDTAEDMMKCLHGIDPSIVEEIRLGGNTIGVDAAEALGNFIGRAKNLKIADLSDIFTGRLITEIPPALTFLCDALKNARHLISVDLSDNAFGGRSVEPLVPLFSENRTLEIINLHNNGLGPEGGAVVADAIFRSAELSRQSGEESRLRKLVCGRTRLENGSSPNWAAALAAHVNLEEVTMPQNGIKPSGIIALAKGLSECKLLRLLDLQDNTVDVDGCEALAQALRSWQALETLNLSDCVLRDTGCAILLGPLAQGSNPKLKSLVLQNNELEMESVAVLEQAFTAGQLRDLKDLQLQWNDLDQDDEGLLALATSLKQRHGKLLLDDEEEEEEEEKDNERHAAEENLRASESIVPNPNADEDKALVDLIEKISLNS